MTAELVTDYDTLLRVFSFFVPPLVDDGGCGTLLALEGRKQLCRLALVSKSFYEPALHCLWTYLPSIRPVLEAHAGLMEVEGVYYHQQVIAPGSLERLERLTQKVRSLRLGLGSTKDIALSTFVWLGQQQASFPLLPALREVCLEGPGGNTEQLGVLSAILSPSIKVIRIRGEFTLTNAFTMCIFPLICNKAKSVEVLSIHDHSSTGHFGIWGAIPNVAGGLPLHTLDIRFPNARTLPFDFLGQTSAKFRKLSRLTLDVHTPSHGPAADISSGVFKSLRSLHLICRSHIGICQCYPTSLLQRATSLTLYLDSNLINADAFEPTMTTLSSIGSLKRLEIKQSPGTCVTIPQSVVTQLIQRLDLEELSMDVWGLGIPENGQSYGFDFLDQAVAPLPGEGDRGSRSLRSLRFPIWRPNQNSGYYSNGYYYANNGRRNNQGAHYPPLATLTSIAKLPGLRQVTLSVDSSATPDGSGTFASLLGQWTGLTSPSSLRHLSLADMRPPDYTALTAAHCRDIAHFLDVIFPDLECLCMAVETGRNVTWDEHWGVIEETRRMRKELRQFRSGGAWK